MRKLIVFGAVLACGASTAYAADIDPGSPDPGFGHAGLATADIATNKRSVLSNAATDAVLDSDGRLLIAGSRRGEFDESAVVAFDRNGKVDRSWGSTGQIVHEFEWRGDYRNPNVYASDIAIAPRGRIITADVVDLATERDWNEGFRDYADPDNGEIDVSRISYYVYAHTRAGKPVRSFGRNGRVRIHASRTRGWQESALNSLFDLAVGSDGSIYMLHRDRAWILQVIKLRPSGRIDSSFGFHGRKSIPISPQHRVPDMASARVFSVGTKVLVTYAVTEQRDQGSDRRAIWIATRMNANGSLDRGYGAKGRFKYTWPSRSSIPIPYEGRNFDAIRDSKGRLVLAGGAWSSGDDKAEDTNGTVLRLTRDGKLDESFGSQGVLHPKDASGTSQVVHGVTQTPDGSYAIGTRTCDESCNSYSSRLLDESGAPAANWAGGGFSYAMGSVRDIVGMYAAGQRVYQVPVSFRRRGAKRERFAALALRR